MVLVTLGGCHLLDGLVVDSIEALLEVATTYNLAYVALLLSIASELRWLCAFAY